MSGIALIWAANVKGLKPAAKIVLIQLADFHNKETGQCNPSAKRLADDCEMGRATLFRHMATLEEKGLVTRHARGDGEGGRGSNHYELHLDVTLGPSARSKGEKAGATGVKSQNETGGKVSKSKGKSPTVETGVVSNRDTNLTIEPVNEPVCAADAAQHTHWDFDEFWKVHPRPRDLNECQRLFSDAVANGVDPKHISAAAEAYAVEQAGNAVQYVKTSLYWLKDRRWEDHKPTSATPQVDANDVARKTASHIIERKPWVANTVSANKARELIAAGLVSAEQCKAAGVAA